MPDKTSVIKEAHTVQVAVQLGLKALGIKKDQASINVLAEGKQGIMGLGAKPARVRVTLKEEVAAEIELQDILVDLEIDEQKQPPRAKLDAQLGIVEIIDGKLIVTNPQLEGKFAQLARGEHVKLTVNGNEIKEETFVTEEDQIAIEIIDDEPVSSLELTISEDKLVAYLKLVQLPGANYKLKDQPQSNSLLLVTEVSQVTELPPVSVAEIKKYLAEQGVVKGIIEESLEEVIRKTNLPGNVPVAKGQASQDGVDAYIRYPFEEAHQDDEEEGLFGRSKLISVTQGEIIAVKVPNVPGQEGWTVTGEVIAPKPSGECELLAKKGCQLSKDGLMVVAEISGRPVTETVGLKNFITIDPIYEVKEVNNKTGNINFNGDVQIQHNIGEGFTTEASGNVEVFGDVTKGTVQAGASVTVHKMVFGSHIIAGGRAAIYSLVMPRLKDVREMLENMYAVAEQLKNSSGFKTNDLQSKGDGPLIRLLTDTKFAELPKAISDIVEKSNQSKTQLHDEYSEVITLLVKSLCGYGPNQLDRIELLQVLQKNVEQIILFVASYMKKAVSLKLRYVQNSSLLSSGDILIDGEGAYISTITAGGEVVITGKVGIARGVVITAHKNVSVKELGSEFDTQTSVKIIGNGKINAELVHSNVKIQIDNEVLRVDKTYRNFSAYLNKEGKLILDGLQADQQEQENERGHSNDGH